MFKGISMGKQLIVNLPDDLKQRLKVYCSENGKTMSNKVTDMLCQMLAEEESGKKAAVPKVTGSKTDVSPPDLLKEEEEAEKAEPFYHNSFMAEVMNYLDGKVDAELEPITERIGRIDEIEKRDCDSLRHDLKEFQNSFKNELSSVVDVLQGLRDSVRTLRDQVNSSGLNALVVDQNKKNSAIANFLANHIEILGKTSGFKICDDDVKGLELLRKEFKV